MDKKQESKLERSPLAKRKKKTDPKRREMPDIVREKTSPGTPLHAGIQITNKEVAIKSIFAVNKVNNEVSFR